MRHLEWDGGSSNDTKQAWAMYTNFYLLNPRIWNKSSVMNQQWINIIFIRINKPKKVIVEIGLVEQNGPWTNKTMLTKHVYTSFHTKEPRFERWNRR